MSFLNLLSFTSLKAPLEGAIKLFHHLKLDRSILKLKDKSFGAVKE